MSSPKLSSRRLALLSGFALLGVIGAASVCSAESPWRRRVVPAPPPPYRVELEALDGSSLPTFRQGGRTFVLGEPGTRYNVRVYNPTGERVEVVLSVDGRDAVSGQPGDYVSQRGYLVEPWGSLLVEGFRRSLDEVAAFRFTERGESYSTLRGTPENVGVIGVAVFPERARPRAPIWRPERRHSSNGRSYDDRPYDGRSYDDRYSPEPSAAAESERERAGSGAARRAPSPAPATAPKAEAAPRDFDGYKGYDDSPRRKDARSSGAGPSNIGTEYGEDRDSSVVEVAFERRSPTHPSALLTLRYDDYSGLEARGIDLSSLRYAYRYDSEPQAFPQTRFAQPPR